jgi:squalene synthase HpnC
MTYQYKRYSSKEQESLKLTPRVDILFTMSQSTRQGIDKAFAYCQNMARSHYENFPVASMAVPRDRRLYVAAIYAFARTADDIDDEGDIPPQERLRRLGEWGEQLGRCYRGEATNPVFIALGETAARTGLPREPLDALLQAFRMDVTTHRFPRFEDVLHYCRHSANPVGRLVLHLFGEVSERTVSLSDSICTGLQLANFWQDLSVDWAKGRLYVPLEDFDRFGYTENELSRGVVDERFRRMMAFEVERARGYLLSGVPLLDLVSSARLRFELSFTVRGGLAILEAVRAIGYDVVHRRPSLSKMNKAGILLRTLLRRSP